MPANVPPTNVGLLIIVPGVAYDDCVAIDDVELERVGDEGRIVPVMLPDEVGGGEGATDRLEDVRWWDDGKGEGGAMAVGVAMGVVWDEVVDMIGCLAVGTSPLYTSPNSEGEKVRVEQKPSEEVIRRV